MAFWNFLRRRHPSCESETTDTSSRYDPERSGTTDTIQRNVTGSLPTQTKNNLLLEAGRQAGMREQKLEEIHLDIKHIRDNMALQASMREFHAGTKETLVRLAEIMTTTKGLLLEKIESLQLIAQPIQRNETTVTVPPVVPVSFRNSTKQSGVAAFSNSDSPPLELSEREKEVLSLLLDTGQLTYVEIADRLHVKPDYAKVLVNRILQKSDILFKEKAEKRNLVGVKGEYRQTLLGADRENSSSSTTQ